MHCFKEKYLSWKTPLKVWELCSASSCSQPCIPLVLMVKPWAHSHSLSMTSGMRCWRTQRSRSLRRQPPLPCFELITCGLSLWAANCLPALPLALYATASVGHGTEKPRKAWHLPRSGNKLQQERAEETSLHQADKCGMKRHRFVTAWLWRGDVCKLARAAEPENTFLVPVALLHNYSCIRLNDRYHWGKHRLLLLLLGL